MKEFSLLRDVDRAYIELWEQCKKDSNCLGIIHIKGRGKPENHFADMVYMIQRNLLEGEIVIVVGLHEKYIDAITEALEMFYQIKPLVDAHKQQDDSGSYSWTLTLSNLKYERGKLYVSGTTTVLCTGVGSGRSRFSGVVVEQLDPISDHQFGRFSQTWSAHSDIFKESMKPITIDPAIWKEYREIPTAPLK
jgi:hypothetical protein